MKNKTLLPWTLKTQEEVLSTPWFSITKQAMQTPTGADATYYVHHADDTVICLCVTDDNKILIERQYRPPIQKISIDFPAGKMEASDSDSTEAMRRELAEEAGFVATEISEIAALDINPGFSTAQLHVFLARGYIATDARPDETESIELEFVTPTQLLKILQSGKMSCTFCVSTTFLAFRKLNWLAPSLP
jgi:ADP-ribose pyrophosphatase